MQAFNVTVTNLADQLSSGAIGVDDWLVAMRREVKDIHVNAVVISRGGASRAVTQAEWGRLGGHLRVQYRYLDNYAWDVQVRAMNALSGGRPLTQNYLEWRSKLYGRNSRASFYRGLAYGLLPQVPGDGQTECLVGCQCVLRFEEGENQGELFVYWELRPAEHCFPAGTMIATPDGACPIEEICVGDLVSTPLGAHRVTRLYQRTTQTPLVRVQAENHRVSCTPNHPFLTSRGWVPAGRLVKGDTVLIKDADDFRPVKLAFPNAHDRETTLGQVGILGAIAALLGKLPLGERLKSWMAMPVVSIGLDDQGIDANVNDEAGFDQTGRFMFDAQTCQDVSKPTLQARGLVPLQASLSSEQSLVYLGSLLGMALSPASKGHPAFWGLHRVVLEHVLPRSLMHSSAISGGIQRKTELVGFISDVDGISIERSPNFLTALCGIVCPEIDFFRIRPTDTSQAMISLPVAVGTAAKTDTPLLSFPFSIVGSVATGNRAESLLVIAALRRGADWLSAVFTWIGRIRHLLLPRNDMQALYPNTRKTQVVYNLEVEQRHQYIANGFVVHNCDDCVRLSEEWNPYVLMLPVGLSAQDWVAWLPTMEVESIALVH